MKKRINLFIILILSCGVLFANQKKKVACIGDSVTKGAGIKNGNSYPNILQDLLGTNYQVANFGRNGATLLYDGHNPYVKSAEFEQAIAFKPDIIIVSLGLNDTDPRNWPNYKNSFQSNYRALIDSFKMINPQTEVFICEMTPIFSGHSRFLSGTRDWYDQIQQEIRHFAHINQFNLIENHAVLSYRIDLFEDYLHPNEQGASLLAHYIYKHLVNIEYPLTLGQTIGSNMVLQREVKNIIYGRAAANQKVTVSYDNTIKSTKTNHLGEWNITIDAFKAGGPYLFKIYSNKDTINLQDVYFGDVYLASGQSNMAFELRNANNSEDLIHQSRGKSTIRLFKNTVLTETNNKEWDSKTLQQVNNLDYFTGNWQVPNPENTAKFSAIAYSFAHELNRTEHIPIGIIELSVGGSNTESWIPRYDLEHDDLLATYIHGWRTSDFIQSFCRERAAVNLKKSTLKHQRHPYDPAYNFEAGVSKWVQTKIKGVLWYQGESNAHNVELHAHLFKKMVQSWRKEFKQKLPFYSVQLSSIDRPSWPYFRDSQRQLAHTIPLVYMAVSSDLGDSLDVHPKEKITIGKRLANLVRKHDFNRNIQADSPELVSIKREGTTKYILRFNNCKHLKTNNNKAVKGFKGTDEFGNFMDFKSIKIVKNQIILTSEKPVRKILYAYKAFTHANLENQDSTPVSTFSKEVM